MAFGAIFFSFGGAQDFLTIILKDAGKENLAFWSLGVLYAAFTLGNFPAAKLIPVIGLKRMMILGAASYSVYIFSLVNMSPFWVVTASAILGLGAAALWNAQGVYLVLAADQEKLGRASGVFTAVWGLASFTGVSLIGFILQFTRMSSENLFLLLAVGPVLGMIFLAKLAPIAADTPAEKQQGGFIKLFLSPSLLGVSLIWVLMVFAEGFSFTILPRVLSRELPAGIIGLLLGLRRIVPIGLAFLVGIASDRIGRGKILRTGVLMYLVGSGLMFWTNKPTLVLATILLALGFAVVRPATFAAVKDISPKGYLPAVNAYLYVVSNLAVLASIIFGGMRAETAALAVMGVTAALAAILSVPLVLNRNVNKQILSEISR